MRVFRDERGQVLTQDELLLEFLHLDAKGETDCENILEYIESCTGKDGTLTEYHVPRYGDTIMLNSFAMNDERIKDWYKGEPLSVTMVDLREWKCWVERFIHHIPLEYTILLIGKDW